MIAPVKTNPVSSGRKVLAASKKLCRSRIKIRKIYI